VVKVLSAPTVDADHWHWRKLADQPDDHWVAEFNLVTNQRLLEAVTSPAPVATADRFDAPVGTEAERNSAQIWPGYWVDATGFAKRYNATGAWSIHTGGDLNLNSPHFDSDAHANCYAPANGLVRIAQTYPVWGNIIVLEHVLPDGAKVWSRLAHLEALNVKAGDVVQRGQLIGRIGNAAGRYAYHLHYDLAKIDLSQTPTHWPGDNKPAVLAAYFDPRQFTLAHRNVTPPPPPPPPPAITFKTGVGVGNPQPLTARELEAIRISRVSAVKLLTLPDPTEMHTAIEAVRRLRADMFIVVRLFFSCDVGNKTRFTPADFVAFCANGLSAAYAAGVRYFEIHNEPNLTQEGLGWNWLNGREFNVWLLDVLRLLRAKYPEAKWGYPGLSPQPNTLAFLDASREAALACDWIGAHAYFRSAAQIGDVNNGMYWLRIKQQFPNKPLMITEFSNNNPAQDYAGKAAQYQTFYATARAEVQVLAAFAFALSWPGQDVNHEAWVVNNALTEIPVALGKLIG
jgi:hypothetical protein